LNIDLNSVRKIVSCSVIVTDYWGGTAIEGYGMGEGSGTETGSEIRGRGGKWLGSEIFTGGGG